MAPLGKATVFIDEVQRLPSLLNTVQALLDEHPGRLRFLLTGSSARKLRRGHANLLPGRVHVFHLGPIVAGEAEYALDARACLETGTLPGVSLEPREDRVLTLASYAATYLREEIQAEALTRNVEGFSRFITAVGEMAGAFLDIAKLASAAQVPRASASRWIEVLEDTLLVRRVSSFAKSVTRRLVQHPKLFLFDVGVHNGLVGNFTASADRVGALFETLLAAQLHDGAASQGEPVRVSTFRTEHGAEVDFIVEWRGRIWAIEAKASRQLSPADARGLGRFADYLARPHEARIFYLGDVPKRIGGVDALPWQQGLREMGL